MLSVVALISGGGSNLAALLEQCDEPEFGVRVVAVGSDRKAPGLAHPQARDIACFIEPFSSGDNREAWGERLIEAITPFAPDLVLLSGFMRLLPPNVVAAFAPNLINTHPAYLPEFPGAHAVADALSAGASHTGASLIVVDNSVDGGPVVSRERVKILPDDTEASLHDRIKKVERRLLANALRDIAAGQLDLRTL